MKKNFNFYASWLSGCFFSISLVGCSPVDTNGLEEPQAALSQDSFLPPILTKVSLQKVIVGSSMSIDFRNERVKNNDNMSYSCFVSYTGALGSSEMTDNDLASVSFYRCEEFLDSKNPSPYIDGSSGHLNYGPLLATGIYAIRIEGKNPYGRDESSFFVTVLPPVETPVEKEVVKEKDKILEIEPKTPLLTKPILPQYIILTEDSFFFDVNNERSGGDSGMTYSCRFDRFIDGAVTDLAPASFDCEDFPYGGINKFNQLTGVFSVGPFTLPGTYEVRIKGQNAFGSDEMSFGIIVQQNKKPKLSRILDQTLAVGGTVLLSPTNTRSFVDSPVTYSCIYDRTATNAIESGSSCGTLPGSPAIKFDPFSGTLNWIPPAGSEGIWEFQITAANSYGTDAAVFVVVVTQSTAKEVTLSYQRDLAVTVGDIVSVDFQNTLTGSDAGVAYYCFYDSLIDGAVAESLVCDGLPGAPSTKFSGTTGALFWTVPNGVVGDIEIKIKAQKNNDADYRTFVISSSAQRFGDIGNSSLVFTPTSWDFGSVAINDTSASQTISVQNTASAPIYIGGISSTLTDFVVNWSSCPSVPSSLASLASCLVNVSFVPKSSGVIGASLMMRFGRSSGASTEYSSVFGLSGRGIGALTFAGLSSVSGVTHNSLTLNWPLTPLAASFLVFEISGGQMLYLTTVINSGGAVTSKSFTNLTPGTTHVYRVRATDQVGTIDSNTADVSATLLPNHAPQITGGPSIPWTVYTGRLVSSLNFSDSTTNGDTDADGDSILYSCVYDIVADLDVSAGTACTSLTNVDGSHPSFDTGTGVFSGWKPQAADLSVPYEFSVTATDRYGAFTSVIFSPTVQSGTPVLTPAPDYVFPNSYFTTTSSISMTFQNTRPVNNNDDMTYTCSFKTLSLTNSASSSCDSLPGTFSLAASSGILTWSPGATGAGAYELTVTGTNLVGSASRVFKLDVLPAIGENNRLLHVDARFYDQKRGGQNPLSASSGTLWKDLSSWGQDLILNNFSTTTAWSGGPTASNPLALVLDGTDDYLTTPLTVSSISTSSTIRFDTWLKEGSAAEKVIMSFGDSSGRGMILTNKRLRQGNGTNTAYSAAVLADSPAFYWSMDDAGTGTATDLSGNSRTGLGQNTGNITALASDALFKLAGGAVTTKSNGYFRPGTGYTPPASWTLEAWVQYPFFKNCTTNGYCAISRGTTTGDFQMVIQAGTLALGLYKAGSPYTFMSSGFSMSGLSRGWHHLVAVGSGTTTSYYVDGSLVGSVAYKSSDNFYYIGGGNGYPAGALDEVAVYPSALSGARIAAHYAAGSAAECVFALDAGTWYNLAGTIDDTGNTISMAINGVQSCSVSKPSSPTVAGTASSELLIGRAAVGAATSWAGSIASFILYSDPPGTAYASNYAASTVYYSGQSEIPPVGLKLWTKADAGVFQDAEKLTPATDGSVVTVWEDQSGWGGDLSIQSYASTARPTFVESALNAYPVLQFDGVANQLLNYVNYGFPNAIFIVGRFAGASPRGRVLSGTNNNWLLGWENANYHRFYAGSAYVSGTGQAATSSWMIYGSDHQSSSQRLFVNGGATAYATSSSGTQGPYGLTVGRYGNGQSQSSYCEVAEIIVYDRVLSTAERAAIFSYLNAKYAVY